MTRPPPTRRARRHRLAVEPLEHRVQPSAGPADVPAGAFSATVAAPLPLAVVDVPLYAAGSVAVAARPAAVGGSAAVGVGAYLAGFDVAGTGDGAVISAAPSRPARLLVSVDAAIPVAADDRYTTAVRPRLLSPALMVSVSGGLLRNDPNPGGGSRWAVAVTLPSNGVLLLGPDGSFLYAASVNFVGTDSFTYRVSDGTTSSAPATVVITVGGANLAHTPRADAYATVEDTPLTVAAPGLLGNDSDADGDTLAAVLGTGPQHGLLTLDARGGFTYTPAADWSGTDSFTYTATDGRLVSAPVTVTLTVSPVNDAPQAGDDIATTAEDVPVLIEVRQNDSDPDGDALSVTAVGPAAHGTVTTDGATVTYTPSVNWYGTDTFTYVVTDDSGATCSASVTVVVTSVNDAPTAADDAFSTTQNTPLTGAGILANDDDIDGDALTAVLVAGPTNGTLRLNADGSFVYTPAPGFTGTNRFTYRASDGSAVSHLATVELRVLPPNGRPVAADDAYAVVGGSVLTVPAAGVLGNDTRSGVAPLTAALVSGPSNGTLIFAADGSFAYTPDAGFVGTDSFNYKAADPGGETGTAQVTIGVLRPNRAPTGAADAVATVAGTAVTLTAAAALANDADPDGDAITAELVGGATHGTIAVSTDGSFTYTPDAGFSGTDTFTYRVTDGALVSGLVQVTVTVASPPTDPPTTPPTPPTPPTPEPPASPTPATPAPTPTNATPTTARPAPTTTTSGPTAATPTAVSIAPSATSSGDGFGPTGGGPAGTVSPVPAVSSGGSTPSPRIDPAPAAEAGRVYSTADTPAAPAPPAVAPAPAVVSPLPPQPAPPPSAVVPPVVVLPPPVVIAPPVGVVPAVLTPPTVIVPDTLLTPLDRVRDELRAEAAERATTDTVVVAGGVAVAGTVLLNTRAIYWFLSALLARPAVWRRFDPLDVIYTWERDGSRGRDDSLQSMVG